jgi:hypothetical protein
MVDKKRKEKKRRKEKKEGESIISAPNNSNP